MYRLQALMLCLCALIVGSPLQGQQPYGTPTYQNTQVWDTYTANAAQISAASLSWTHYERLGYTAGSLQFAFQITGTPSTLSAKVQPCMRNPTDQPTGGTCPAAAAITSTATSSFVLSLSGPWDYYVVTVTWTGGGITAITNKVTGIGGTAKTGTGGGGTIAATALVLKGDNAGNAIAGVPGTDYVIPSGNVASVGNSSSTLNGIRKANTGSADTAATSPQIVAVLNTSPTTPIGTPVGGTGKTSFAPFVDYAVPAYLNPTNGQNNDIAKIYNQVLQTNHFYFSCDNSDGWHAGSAYSSFGMFAFDIAFAMQAYPSYFTPAQVKNVVLKLDGARDGSGNFPYAVANNCTAGSSTYYSGFDNAHLHPIPEGATGSAYLVNLYWHETGDTSLYTSVVADIKVALANIPRNGTTHLITVSPTAQYNSCTGYMETMRSTGDNACANVAYYYAMKALQEVATAAGDSTNATFFASEATTVQAALISGLTDGTTQMLKTDTGQLASNLDAVSSSWGCYPFANQSPVLGSTQCTAIANFLNTNANTMSFQGYFQYTNTTYAVIGTIPVGGSGQGALGAGYGAGQYQNNGYWPEHVGWILYSINKVAPGAIAGLVQSYRNSANPGIEYYDLLPTPQPGVNASTTLITAGSGQKLISDINPPALPPQQTGAVCVVDAYGVCYAVPGFTVVTSAGYVDVAFNNNHTNTGRIGLVANSTGSDLNLYYDTVTGGVHTWRINGTAVAQLSGSLFSTTKPSSSPQFISTGSTPTIANGAGAGTAPGTPTITGTNMDGVIVINTGTLTLASSTLVTITFNGTLVTAPNHCTLQSMNTNAAINNSTIFTTVPSTTSWTIATSTVAPATGSGIQVGYHCQ